MADIAVRKGRSEDSDDFARLLVLSWPGFSILFAPRVEETAKRLFQQPGNLFSLSHSYFAEVDGKVAGLLAVYSRKHEEEEVVNTRRLLAKHLGWRFMPRFFYWVNMRRALKLMAGECYVNSLAVYPEFRRLGVATRLLLAIEAEMAESVSRIMLDVEVGNQPALNLYRKAGYAKEAPASFKIKDSENFRMAKLLK
ncbi:MAG: GNAT family N-acetyltransferase [Chloroflexi bacterium]|nr:GNAT family N-acetyltransferase [Chloroflexota bacterium]